MLRSMIVTIDGPAGTGKSTVAQAVAARLGAAFLDTGAMYRAIGLAAMRAGARLDDADLVGKVAERVSVGFDFSTSPPSVLLDGEAVEELIRTPEVTKAASAVAAAPAVRAVLVREQQRIGREWPNLVTEGRDQGTVVFPQADVKFYLDAKPQERARRRVEQLQARGGGGQDVEFGEVLREILARDERDAGRAVGPLRVPAGAIVVDTTGMSPGQVIDLLVEKVKGRGAR
jgi:cytidylate kinase